MDDGRDDEGVRRAAGDRTEKRGRGGLAQQDGGRAAVNANLGVKRTEIKLDGEELLIMREEEVLGILKK